MMPTIIDKDIEIRLAEIRFDKELRQGLDQQLTRLHGLQTSRERALAITKLQEAIMWLGMDLKRLGADNPYPGSYDPNSPMVHPVADNLQM